jgi:hypothetical protein
MTSRLPIVLIAVVLAAAWLAPSPPVAAQAAAENRAAVSGGCPTESIAFQACAREKASAFEPPRTAEGVPNLQGYWRSRNNGIAYNVEPSDGGFSVPPTGGEIVDPPNKLIPYQPWALARRNELREKAFEDPQGHCAPSGAPRKVNTLFGWKLLQPRGYVVFMYESMHDYRLIPTSGREHLPARVTLWHGDPVGHWEGNTLVVDYKNLNGKHWFDMSGNFQSDNIHVVERYTLFDPDTILFEATIEDDTMYTQPWTLVFSLVRNTEEGYYQLEYACHEGERDLQHFTDDTGRGESEQFRTEDQR